MSRSSTSPATGSAPERRSRRRAAGGGRRPDLTVVLGVLLPAAALAAAALVSVEPSPPAPRAPERAALTSSTLVCPSADGDAQVGLATTTPRVRGEVEVADARPLPVATGRVSRSDLGAAVVLTGAGDTAPGLVATRFVAAPLAAAGCRPPTGDVWFPGVSAAARRASVLELVNPDAGPAVVDVDLHGARGLLDVPELRGLTVPGGGTLRLDLAERVPRRGTFALHAVTARGRAAVFVENREDPLGRAEPSRDWQPGQLRPDSDPLLLGVPTGEGEQSLVLANPGDDEVRAEVRFVTGESTFAPSGLDQVRVPPQGVVRVPLTQPLAAAEDVLGVQVRASGAVVAAAQAFVDGDLALTGAAVPSAEPAALVLPPGAKRLLLSGADSTGAVAYTARSASGEELAADRVEIVPERGLSIELPDEAALVEVAPHGTAVAAAVLVTSRTSSTVLALAAPARELLVPDVAPGLP